MEIKTAAQIKEEIINSGMESPLRQSLIRQKTLQTHDPASQNPDHTHPPMSDYLSTLRHLLQSVSSVRVEGGDRVHTLKGELDRIGNIIINTGGKEGNEIKAIGLVIGYLLGMAAIEQGKG